MSLQTHTDVSVAPPVTERVELPVLPLGLHLGLIKAAATYGMPVDELADYLLCAEPRTRLDVRAFAESNRRRRIESQPSPYTAVCVRGGSCLNAFTWRGVARCGCRP